MAQGLPVPAAEEEGTDSSPGLGCKRSEPGTAEQRQGPRLCYTLPAMTQSSLRRLTLLTLASVAILAAGCQGWTTFSNNVGVEYDRAFGIRAGGAVLLQLQAIQLRSDHSIDPAQLSGPAQVQTGDVVKFSAIGLFLQEGSASLATNDVSSGVVWTSTNPSLGLPGADGRIAAQGTAEGQVTIIATTPGFGTIPAIQSNPITLTIQ